MDVCICVISTSSRRVQDTLDMVLYADAIVCLVSPCGTYSNNRRTNPGHIRNLQAAVAVVLTRLTCIAFQHPVTATLMRPQEQYWTNNKNNPHHCDGTTINVQNKSNVPCNLACLARDDTSRNT